MVRLESGMLIKTNYLGPYRIVEVMRNCTCPSYVDEINMVNPPEREAHMHLVLSGPDGKGIFYLNGFNEQTLLSLNKTFCGHKKEFDYDRIIILAQDRPIQGTLF